uniref:Uncharacterized protein n=1 Tax=Sus scrofa TaxID=9823 RepID=A0A4X1SYQ2_PIG
MWRFPGSAAGLHHSTATQDLSRVCDLHPGSRQCRIPHPLSKARDQTCMLMDTSWVRFHRATTGTPGLFFKKREIILYELHWTSLIYSGFTPVKLLNAREQG